MGELRDRRRARCRPPPVSAEPWFRRDLPRAFNAGKGTAHGWGVAMSTDTAFALGMLALVGARFPQRLRAFMLTVSVVDDLGALIVIATVYAAGLPPGLTSWRLPSESLRGSGRARSAPLPARHRVRGTGHGRVGGALEVRCRPGRIGPHNGTADVRSAGRAQRSGTRHEPVSAVSASSRRRSSPGQRSAESSSLCGH